MKAGFTERPAYLAYHWFWQSLDWLYPPVCGGCGQKGARWCSTCQAQVQLVGTRICPVCGEPRPDGQKCLMCQKKADQPMVIRSWSVFGGPVREALHRLKYRRDMGLGEALARPLAGFLISLGWQVDLALPVPLSQGRLKDRGYNQVSLLVRPMALAMGLRYAPQALLRVRETRSQVGLSPEQRKENVAGAFKADPRQVSGKRVMVVDDVMTTGATLEACGQALYMAGASSVCGLTLTRAVLDGSRGSAPGHD